MRIALTTLAGSMLLASCATTAPVNNELTELEARLEANENSGQIQQYAAVELDRAARQVEAARLAWAEYGTSDRYQHQFYLAERAVETAETKAAVGATEDRAKTLSRERDKLRLQAQASDAHAARIRAESSAAEATAAAALAAANAEEQERRRLQAEARAAAAEQRNEELMRQLSDLHAQETERGLLFTLQDVLFDFDKADLKPGAERQLDKIGAFLAANPERKVRVEGFTDSVGSDSYNQNLSERRANSVKASLIGNGINPGRVEIEGYGEQYPVASNDNDAGRQQNRRVEIIVSLDDQPVEERSS